MANWDSDGILLCPLRGKKPKILGATYAIYPDAAASAHINPAALPLPTVVPYARTPTGQGVDLLVFRVDPALPTWNSIRLTQMQPIPACGS